MGFLKCCSTLKNPSSKIQKKSCIQLFLEFSLICILLFATSSYLWLRGLHRLMRGITSIRGASARLWCGPEGSATRPPSVVAIMFIVILNVHMAAGLVPPNEVTNLPSEPNHRK